MVISGTEGRKSLISVGLVLLMVLSLVAWVPVKSAATHPGSGTEADPYEIDSVADLENIDEDLSAHYELVSDIDASGSSYNAPTGNFTGTLDGNGFSVTNISLAKSGQYNNGLFAKINGTGGTIKNINVHYDTVVGESYVAGIVGYVPVGSVHIENVEVSGTIDITGSNSTVAGIVGGNNDQVWINDSKVTDLTIKGQHNAGGFIAVEGDPATHYIENPVVKNTTVDITGWRPGGMIGEVDTDLRIINATMTNVTVSGGGRYTGGMIADADSSSLDLDLDGAELTDINVTSTGDDIGGLIGFTKGGPSEVDDVTMTDITVSGSGTGIGGVHGRSWSAPAAISYTDIDLNSVHVDDDGNEGSITFGSANGLVNITSITVDDSTISGSGNTHGGIVGYSYDDTNVKDATLTNVSVGGGTNIGVAFGVSGFGKIEADGIESIDSTVTGNAHLGGIIGGSGSDIDLTNSKVVRFENNDFSDSEIGGVLGSASGGGADVTIKNVQVTDGTVTGVEEVGGVVGHSVGHIHIEDTTVTADVNFTDIRGAGFVGGNLDDNGNDGAELWVNSSTYSGTVSGGRYVGGVVGLSGSSSDDNAFLYIEDVQTSGKVESIDTEAQRAAGIAAVIATQNGRSSYLIEVSSTMDVTVRDLDIDDSIGGDGDFVGGLVSDADAGDDANPHAVIIRRSYYHGDITGDRFVGGLVGWSNNVSIEDSYSRGSVNGTKSVGGLIGDTEGIIHPSGFHNVSRSYTTARVTGINEDRTGAIIGGSRNVTYKNVYYDRQTVGLTNDTGILVGGGPFSTTDEGTDLEGVFDKSTKQMKKRSTYNGFNFKDVWYIRFDVNDGYPELRWVPFDVPSNKDRDFFKSLFKSITVDEPFWKPIFERAMGLAGRAKDTATFILLDWDPGAESNHVQDLYNDQSDDFEDFINKRMSPTTKMDVVRIDFVTEDDSDRVYWVAQVTEGKYINSKIVEDTDREADEWVLLCDQGGMMAEETLYQFWVEFVHPNENVPPSERVRIGTRFGPYVKTSFLDHTKSCDA